MPEPCAELDLPSANLRHLTVGFQSGSLSILEALTVPKLVRRVYRELEQHYSECRKILPIRHLKVTGTGKKLSMSRIGDQSQAFSFDLVIKGFHVNEDLVVFRKSFSCGVVEFVSVSPLDLQQFELVASIAASKSDSVVSVPTGKPIVQ
jgi:hypothetical protein